MTSLTDIEAVALASVLAGGEELRRRFRNDDIDAEFGRHDVKAAADKAAEGRMLPVIRQMYPDHVVYSEEAGEFAGSAPYEWIIDPLDGTNNFAAGLPTFATSVAVLCDTIPVLAAVYQPMTDETYLGRREAGVRYQGRQVIVSGEMEVDASSVAMIVGRDVARDVDAARRARAIRDALNERVRRVIDSWAPTIYSGLFARGRIQGLVQFRPDKEEQAITELLASEAGAAIRQEGSVYVAASDEESLSTLWSAVNSV